MFVKNIGFLPQQSAADSKGRFTLRQFTIAHPKRITICKIVTIIKIIILGLQH